MADIKPPKAGDLITEGLLARIVGRFTRFDNIRSDSPYIRITDGPNGKDLALDLPRPTRALLSGSTSPYSWTEVTEGPSGTWVAMPDGDSGTAYEVNGKSGLAGKVVPITWTAAGDWRFQFIGYTNPPCVTGRICVTVQSTGCGFDLEGVEVTVTDNDGVVIGTGSATGSPAKYCVDIPTAGTYHVASHVPGATDKTASVNATCGVDNNVTLTYASGTIGRACFIAEECDCTGTHKVSASVTGSGTGSFSGTTDPITGQVCFILGTGSGYSATVTYPSGYTKTGPISIAACTTTTSSTLGVSGLVIRALGIPPGCTITLTLTGAISGVCVATSPQTECCITFAPVDIGVLFNVHYQSSGGGWNNNQGVNVQCYPASAPLVFNFLNIC